MWYCILLAVLVWDLFALGFLYILWNRDYY